jgi:hypothetical protein
MARPLSQKTLKSLYSKHYSKSDTLQFGKKAANLYGIRNAAPKIHPSRKTPTGCRI